MYRPSAPQLSLMETKFLLSPQKRARLEHSWAEVFRTRILPLIHEEPFRASYSATLGRPNVPVRLLVGLEVLKHSADLTDAEVLDQLEFNLQWQHALGVEPATAHVCQKTLHNFRCRLLEHEPAQTLFSQVVRAMVEMDGLRLDKQRLDSTHLLSNIAVLSRLGLFVETVTHFLKTLVREEKSLAEALPRTYRVRYLEREGYFSDASHAQGPRRLQVVAQDGWRLVERFREVEAVCQLEAYQLLVRLIEEQCVLPGEASSDGTGGQGAGSTGRLPIQLEAFTSEETGAEGDEDWEVEAPGTGGGDQVSAAGAEPAGSGEKPDSANSSRQEGPPAEAVEGQRGGKETPTEPLRVKAAKEVRSDSLQSPYDPDATYGHKGKGYEAQISETCHPDNPYQVITSLELNGAHESDQQQLVEVLSRLEEAELKPETLFTDRGYSSGKNLVEAGRRGVELHAPVKGGAEPESGSSRWEEPVEAVGRSEGSSPPSGQVLETGGSEKEVQEALGLEDFRYGLDYQTITSCPAGQRPVGHQPTAGGTRVVAQFDPERCQHCPLAGRCPTRERVRLFGSELDFPPERAALKHRRKEQQSAAFKDAYRIRSGIEATNATLKGPLGAGDLRVRGRARVRLVMRFKALALNIRRCVSYHLLAGSLTSDAEGLACAA